MSYNVELSSSTAASNSQFSRIMVAIDGSEHSLKAAEYALEVAKSFNLSCLLGNIALKKGGLADFEIQEIEQLTNNKESDCPNGHTMERI